ncbi:putative D,D-dipeptide transport ATP-binding protein DdpF [bacterium BMS3Abin04]|nr:putative D,D-dipeptide transport ATP-binding protein DdpF [bacterium BMS3Abin04]
MKPQIELKDIAYVPSEDKLLSKGKNFTILSNISFAVAESSILGIVGESGSGKTTLIKLITGILGPTSGTIEYSFPLNRSNGVQQIQILFQNSEQIINPLRKVKSLLDDITKDASEQNFILDFLEIPQEMLQKKGYQLSGGERQRAALARILLAKPKVLIVDEPFSAQDPESKQNFVKLFQKLNKEFNITILCVIHEIDILEDFTEQLLVLFGGKVMEIGASRNIFAKPVNPYTKFLLEAGNYELTENDFSGSNIRLNNSSGCPYFDRCKNKLEECEISVKKMELTGRIVYCNNPLNNYPGEGTDGSLTLK